MIIDKMEDGHVINMINFFKVTIFIHTGLKLFGKNWKKI
jgi:hypothetical protein